MKDPMMCNNFVIKAQFQKKKGKTCVAIETNFPRANPIQTSKKLHSDLFLIFSSEFYEVFKLSDTSLKQKENPIDRECNP